MFLSSINVEIENKKNHFIAVFAFATMILCTLFGPVFMKESFSRVVIANSLISIGIMLYLWKSNYIKCKNVSKWPLICILVIGISFLAMGAYFRVAGYIAIGLIFSVIIPLFIIYASSDFNFNAILSDAIVLVAVIVTILSIFCGPLLKGAHYSSLFENPNKLGGLCIIITAAVLYRFFYLEKKRDVIINLFLYCINITLCFFSTSRTSMIAIFLQSVIFLFLFVRKYITKKTLSDFIKWIIVSLIILSITFGAMFALLKNENIRITQFSGEERYHDNIGDASFEDSMKSIVSYSVKGLKNNENDAFTSGRMGIWKAFIDDIGFIGHKTESKDIDLGTRVYHQTNAHNVYLQVAYSAGLVAGIALLALAISIFIMSIKNFIAMMKKNNALNYEIAFSVFAAAGFGVTSITSGGYLIYTYLPAMLFWMTLGGLFIKKQKN